MSLNKCFEKIENPMVNGGSRKGCLWGLNPAKVDKMDEEITKWIKRASKSNGPVNGGNVVCCFFSYGTYNYISVVLTLMVSM